VTPRAKARVGPWEQCFDRLVLALGHSAFGPSGRGRPRGILHVFRLVERLLARGHDFHPLRPGGIVRYEIAPLPARALRLGGGVVVAPGELVVMLHFDNQAIAALSAPGTQALTWQMVRAARLDLRALAALSQRGALPSAVRAVWAETLFYQSLARYGFATRPARRGVRAPFARLFMLTLLAIYGRDGVAGVDPSQLPLGEAWTGLNELRRRFAQ
jgi:hypothetical protein